MGAHPCMGLLMTNRLHVENVQRDFEFHFPENQKNCLRRGLSKWRRRETYPLGNIINYPWLTPIHESGDDLNFYPWSVCNIFVYQHFLTLCTRNYFWCTDENRDRQTDFFRLRNLPARCNHQHNCNTFQRWLLHLSSQKFPTFSSYHVWSWQSNEEQIMHICST